MRLRFQYVLPLLFLFSVFSFCIRRDIRVEKQYTVDLRNRVVGARLQMDGKLPYIYRWHTADGMRYYDPAKFDTTYASAITASPFFHILLYPLANLQQRKISQIWLIVQYVLFFCCIIVAFSFAKTLPQQWAVTVVAALFPFTEAWLMNINTGQIYLFFPFLCFIFLLLLKNNQAGILFFFAGLAAAVLLLSRPSFLLFFLPFFYIRAKFSKSQYFLFLIPFIVLVGFFVFNHQQRNLWIDYKNGIAAHIRHHLSKDVFARNDAYQPTYYQKWEGWDQDSIKKAKQEYPLKLHPELSGVPIFFRNNFKVIPSAIILNISMLTVIAILLFLYYLKQRNGSPANIPEVVILGYCFCMISDFFSPILRSEYYGVQWIFPLLLTSAFYNSKITFLYFFLIAGIVLNIVDVSFIPMRHTLGELLILFTVLYICLDRQSRIIDYT